MYDPVQCMPLMPQHMHFTQSVSFCVGFLTALY